MENYKQKLLEQYKSSQGINSSSNQSKIYMADFVPWLLKQQSIGNNYAEFLEYLELPFDNYNCAEVGKNEFDTIVKPYRTTIITSDMEGLATINQTRIINGDFQVQRELPTIIIPSDNHTIRKIIPQTRIRTYMTQNPYNQSNITNWENLHNSKEAAIILGVYGSTYDKDIEEKIKQLQDLKEKLLDDIIESYEEYNDEYYYVISSNIKSSRKCLTR